MKKRGIRAIYGFRKKLFIPDHEISVAIEHVVKSKIGTIFKKEKILEEYSVKYLKNILIFVSNIKNKYKLTKMIKNTYCLELIFFFTKYCLAVEIDEKGHTDRDFKFEEKRREALQKKRNCTFIRTNTSRENFDADYEASEIQAFISQFKDNEIKERNNKNKELEGETEKLKLQLAKLSVKNNVVNYKK